MNIFFGAGKLGKEYYVFWRECGIVVDYFMDNDPGLWHKRIEGLEVIPPENLKNFTKDINILITCRDWKPIWLQLRELGVQDHRIRRCNSGVAMLAAIRDFSPFWPPLEMPKDTEPCPSSVLFGLDAGLTLGGVEFWSLNTATELRKLGWTANLLLNYETQPAMREHEDGHMIKAGYPEGTTGRCKLSLITGQMLQYRNVICNFTGDNLTAACLIKERFPMRYRVIAVIHNDEEMYYQNYMDAEPHLDKCLIISSKMGAEMVKRGFPKEKLMFLPWKIPCNEVFSHCYSQWNEPLRIGYAGRVVVPQKRADHILTIAIKLEERGVDFRIEIAGTGSYEEELRLQIQASGLNNKVCCLGMLEDMSPFWNRQDIMISCSEYEGHSISQCEAMAAGAVPVITDTSGARDDVEDGKNGFVVEVSNIDQMVERICYFYMNREQLPEFGRRAHEKIWRYSQSIDIQKFWECILLK